MTFLTDLDDDMEDVFNDVTEFGEALTLTFDDASTRSIVGVVWEQRGALDNLEQALITIQDHATLGATAAELGGGMTITRTGNSEVWTIADIQTGIGEHIIRALLPLERN
jgi:hypothetical protein